MEIKKEIKNKKPYMQFFPNDWKDGVSRLNLLERGIYDTLMFDTESNGWLPKERVPLLLFGMVWDDVPEIVKSKFMDVDGCIMQKRVYKDLNQYDSYIEKCRINGAKGGRKSRIKKSESNHSNSNSNSNSNSISKSRPNSKDVYIPRVDEFIEYGFELCKVNKVNTEDYQYPLLVKYESYIDNDWRDGYNKPIKNWKLTLKKTFSYLKPVKNEQRKQGGKPSDKY